MIYVPKRVFFEQNALEYPLGENLYNLFGQLAIPLERLPKSNRIPASVGLSPRIKYREGKDTLVVGVRKTLKFETCKPSAHFQLPLVSNCAGKCQYCYLHTQLAKSPYMRVYVNIEEILERAKKYMEQTPDELMIFEGAATSDPIPVERYTGSLRKTIEFFAQEKFGRFRFVTKFDDVSNLLDIEHGGHTEFRFTLNTDTVIRNYEQGTASYIERLEALKKVHQAKYPVGILIAPIMIYPGWEQEYELLVKSIGRELSEINPGSVTFELITHRFTSTAKKRILEIFPKTTLPMNEEERTFKYGQFGYGKYVYSKEQIANIKELFTLWLKQHVNGARILYIV